MTMSRWKHHKHSQEYYYYIIPILFTSWRHSDMLVTDVTLWTTL